jgi:hypothetical protein
LKHFCPPHCRKQDDVKSKTLFETCAILEYLGCCRGCVVDSGQREDTLPHCGILIWGKFWHEFGANAWVTARDLAILSTSFHVQVY